MATSQSWTAIVSGKCRLTPSLRFFLRLATHFAGASTRKPSLDSGVGQDKQPLPLVRCPDFRRRKQARRNSITHSP